MAETTEKRGISIERINIPLVLTISFVGGALLWANNQSDQQAAIRKEFSEALKQANESLTSNLTKNREELLSTVRGLKDDLQSVKADLRVDLGELRHKLDLQELRINSNDSREVWAALAKWIEEAKKDNPNLQLPPPPVILK